MPLKHPLAKFDLRLSSEQLLYVGGRVRDEKSPFHPKEHLLLSLKSILTKLLLRTLHYKHKHPGPSTLLAIVAEKYHIPGAKAYLKLVSRQCIVCQRAYARPTCQRMGLLPSLRTMPSPPFDKTGIDFAGPFTIHQGNPRKPVRIKVYGVLFVCFVTRAVHLELCTNLSTEAFLATFSRFCCRRGTPSHLFTDNGTNFIGARNEMKKLSELLTSQKRQEGMSHLSTTSNIHWHMSPPRAPHFGGLWEAGVRAMKTLLRKLVAPHLMSYE